MKLHWFLDVDIIGETNADLPVYLRNLGYTVTALSATKDFRFPPFDIDSHTLYAFHGSFEELRNVQKYVQVATYGIGSSVTRSRYTSYIPNDWFLNYDSVMTTWGDFCQRPEHYRNVFNSEHEVSIEVFIRPDSGFKIFTGQCINLDNFEEARKALEHVSTVTPETIMWVSSPKAIEHEYRFWISDRKVVAWSEYSWLDSKLTPSPKAEKMARDLAEKVAAYEWQLDRIYVVDIHYGFEEEDASIIEFNSFSCSGLYDCDGKVLFKQVSEDILAEWD